MKDNKPEPVDKPSPDWGAVIFAVFLLALTGLLYMIMVIDEFNDQLGNPLWH